MLISYLIELRNIAVNFRLISSTTVTRLKRSAILLGSRRVKKNSVTSSDRQDDLEEDDWDLEYDLVTPDRVVIADDSNLYQLFGSSIFTAPQEEIIEGMHFLEDFPRFAYRIRLRLLFTIGQ